SITTSSPASWCGSNHALRRERRGLTPPIPLYKCEGHRHWVKVPVAFLKSPIEGWEEAGLSGPVSRPMSKIKRVQGSRPPGRRVEGEEAPAASVNEDGGLVRFLRE